MDDVQVSGVEFPDAEVIIRILGDEVAAIAFFTAPTEGVLEVACGVEDPALVEHYASLLKDAAVAIASAHFTKRCVMGERDSPDEGGEKAVGEGKDIPF